MFSQVNINVNVFPTYIQMLVNIFHIDIELVTLSIIATAEIS